MDFASTKDLFKDIASSLGKELNINTLSDRLVESLVGHLTPIIEEKTSKLQPTATVSATLDTANIKESPYVLLKNITSLLNTAFDTNNTAIQRENKLPLVLVDINKSLKHLVELQTENKEVLKDVLIEQEKTEKDVQPKTILDAVKRFSTQDKESKQLNQEEDKPAKGLFMPIVKRIEDAKKGIEDAKKEWGQLKTFAGSFFSEQNKSKGLIENFIIAAKEANKPQEKEQIQKKEQTNLIKSVRDLIKEETELDKQQLKPKTMLEEEAVGATRVVVDLFANKSLEQLKGIMPNKVLESIDKTTKVHTEKFDEIIDILDWMKLYCCEDCCCDGQGQGSRVGVPQPTGIGQGAAAAATAAEIIKMALAAALGAGAVAAATSTKEQTEQVPATKEQTEQVPATKEQTEFQPVRIPEIKPPKPQEAPAPKPQEVPAPVKKPQTPAPKPQEVPAPKPQEVPAPKPPIKVTPVRPIPPAVPSEPLPSEVGVPTGPEAPKPTGPEAPTPTKPRVTKPRPAAVPVSSTTTYQTSTTAPVVDAVPAQSPTTYTSTPPAKPVTKPVVVKGVAPDGTEIKGQADPWSQDPDYWKEKTGKVTGEGRPTVTSSTTTTTGGGGRPPVQTPGGTGLGGSGEAPGGGGRLPTSPLLNPESRYTLGPNGEIIETKIPTTQPAASTTRPGSGPVATAEPVPSSTRPISLAEPVSKTFAEETFGKVNDALRSSYEKIKELGKTGYETAKTGLEAGRQKTQTLIEEAKAKVSPLIESGKEKVKPIVESVKEQVKPIVESVKEQGRPIVEKAKEIATSGRDYVERGLTNVESGIDRVKKFAEPVTKPIGEVYTKADEVFQKFITPKDGGLFSKAKEFAEPVTKPITEAYTKADQWVRAATTPNEGGILSKVKQLAEPITKPIGEALSGVKNWAEPVTSKLKPVGEFIGKAVVPLTAGINTIVEGATSSKELGEMAAEGKISQGQAYAGTAGSVTGSVADTFGMLDPTKWIPDLVEGGGGLIKNVPGLGGIGSTLEQGGKGSRTFLGEGLLNEVMRMVGAREKGGSVASTLSKGILDITGGVASKNEQPLETAKPTKDTRNRTGTGTGTPPRTSKGTERPQRLRGELPPTKAATFNEFGEKPSPEKQKEIDAYIRERDSDPNYQRRKQINPQVANDRFKEEWKQKNKKQFIPSEDPGSKLDVSAALDGRAAVTPEDSAKLDGNAAMSSFTAGGSFASIEPQKDNGPMFRLGESNDKRLDLLKDIAQNSNKTNYVLGQLTNVFGEFTGGFAKYGAAIERKLDTPSSIIQAPSVPGAPPNAGMKNSEIAKMGNKSQSQFRSIDVEGSRPIPA